MIIKENNWESYFYKNENILKNKLNIHDEIELKKKEYEIVTRKNIILYLSDIQGDFDIEHLKNIHKFLFEDVYPFAGKFRLVNMGKDNRASFTDYKTIEKNLKDILFDIDSKLINKAYSKFLYAEALAFMYHELLEIHPFREGNGRTVREFLRQYVSSRNKLLENIEYHLEYTLSNEEKILFENATKSHINGPLVLIFNKMLKEKSKSVKLKK